jgi:predicted dehydrogenase
MVTLAVVGAGACFNNYILPALQVGQRGLSLKAVIDTRPAGELNIPKDLPHILRPQPDTPLGPLLKDRGIDVVILTHANDRHVPDAQELARNDLGVLIEKPYALNHEQLRTVEGLVHSGKAGLLEYYLGKTAPLQMLIGNMPAGPVNLGLIEGSSEEMKQYALRFRKLIGFVKKVDLSLLEGEGDTGSFLHRDHSVSRASLGGGVLQDLGVHVFSMLASLGLGKVKITSYQAAVSDTHREYLLQKGVPLEDIAETFARVQGRAGRADFTAAMGKYVDGWDASDNMSGINNRYLRIEGTHGEVDVNLSTLEMTIRSNGMLEGSVIARKTYVPVLNAALDTLGNPASPLMGAALKGQRAALDLKGMQNNATLPVYKAGTEAAQILR